MRCPLREWLIRTLDAVRTSGSEAEELAVGKDSGEQLREVTQVLQGADVLDAERPFETSGRLKGGGGSVN